MPVMLVYGDSDMFRPEHIVEFYQLLGGGLKDAGWMREHMSQNRLAILPDLTHYETFSSPSWRRPCCRSSTARAAARAGPNRSTNSRSNDGSGDMRHVVGATFLSLDGVMQAPGGAEDPTGGFAYGGWTVHYWDEPMGQFMGEMLSEPFDLLLGRKTYEIFAAHWPFVGADDPIAESFNAVNKYVATSSTEPLTWTNSVALRGDVAAEIARLKQEDGPTLLTQGSSVLVADPARARPDRRVPASVFPLLLGRASACSARARCRPR